MKVDGFIEFGDELAILSHEIVAVFTNTAKSECPTTIVLRASDIYTTHSYKSIMAKIAEAQKGAP